MIFAKDNNVIASTASCMTMKIPYHPQVLGRKPLLLVKHLPWSRELHQH